MILSIVIIELILILEMIAEGLSPPTYLGLQSAAITLCLLILMLEGSVLHAGYKHIKRQMYQRDADDRLKPLGNGGTPTLKPTSV